MRPACPASLARRERGGDADGTSGVREVQTGRLRYGRPPYPASLTGSRPLPPGERRTGFLLSQE